MPHVHVQVVAGHIDLSDVNDLIAQQQLQAAVRPPHKARIAFPPHRS